MPVDTVIIWTLLNVYLPASASAVMYMKHDIKHTNNSAISRSNRSAKCDTFAPRVSKKEAINRAIEMLKLVGIPEPAQRVTQDPKSCVDFFVQE